MNCATFSKHLLPIFMSWFCPAFGDETATYCNVFGYWDVVWIGNSIYWISVSQLHSITTVQTCSVYSHTSRLALSFHFRTLGFDAPGLCLGPSQVSACLSVSSAPMLTELDLGSLGSQADWLNPLISDLSLPWAWVLHYDRWSVGQSVLE
jgi:hypothetical protein